jgi:hypothetical protein
MAAGSEPFELGTLLPFKLPVFRTAKRPFIAAANGGRRGSHTAWSDVFPLPRCNLT